MKYLVDHIAISCINGNTLERTRWSMSQRPVAVALVGNLHNQIWNLFTNSLSQILWLHSNNSQSLTFSQLGADDGLHFP